MIWLSLPWSSSLYHHESWCPKRNIWLIRMTVKIQMNHPLHLAHMLRGDRPPLSQPISSSISCVSKQRPLLLTLISELALLLVARGESETLTVLLRDGPDRTLYIEEAGIFVINGRKLPGMLRLISCSRKKCIVLNKNMHWKESVRACGNAFFTFYFLPTVQFIPHDVRKRKDANSFHTHTHTQNKKIKIKNPLKRK